MLIKLLTELLAVNVDIYFHAAFFYFQEYSKFKFAGVELDVKNERV